MFYRLAVILLLNLVVSTLYGQAADSLSHKPNFDAETFSDTLTSLSNTPIDRIDSLQGDLNNSVGAVQHSYDSILSISNRPVDELDSIQNAANESINSLKTSYDSVISISDKAQSAIQSRIDSLTQINLPSDHLVKKLDSIQHWRTQKLGAIDKEVTKLKSKLTDKINSLEIPDELKEKASSLTGSLDKLDLSLPRDQIPGLESLNQNIPGLNSPNLPSGNVGLDANVPGVSNPIGEGIPGADGLTIPDSGLGKIGNDISGYQNELGQIPKSTDEMSKLAESKVGDIDQVAGVQGQLGEVAKMKESLPNAQDPEAMKQELKDMATKEAVNHFAGKEEQLQQAMNKLAEYKKKYSSVQSIADLPKKRPNEMRSKPFIERLLPGIALQIHRKGDWLLDLNPYVGYRFTTRLTTGIGWNERIAYNTDDNAFHSDLHIYGPRVYGEYKIGKGFGVHLNMEYMNTFVPPQFSSTTDPNHREWVFSTMAGLKKEYKFIKNVKGTLYILYNLYDPYHRSPYGDKLNMRLGFEFPIKKKKKQ